MTAAKYHNAALDSQLSGRIITSYSCEFNYFTSCAENAKICGDQCKKTTPQLNVIGEADHYFGNHSGSISYDVAAASNGYGGPITGNCRKAYNDQQFTKSTVVVFPGVDHGLTYSHGNALRSILADFLTTPSASASSWASLNRTGCSLADGIYKCDGQTMDAQNPCVSYQVNPNASWIFTGANKVDQCAATATTTGAAATGSASPSPGSPSPSTQAPPATVSAASDPPLTALLLVSLVI